MAIYLGETRAATNAVTAAIERFLGRVLFGPRQHDDDLRAKPPVAPRLSSGESNHESVQR